jgi:hypothetical protein
MVKTMNRTRRGNFLPLSEREEEVGRTIVDAAYKWSGYLINFNSVLIKNGIKRLILES